MTEEAKRYIESRTALRPSIAVVLGSGLGAFADELSERVEIPYAEIPGWPASTAVGHAGKLILGKLGDLEVAVMAGRAHLYEGNTPAQVDLWRARAAALGVDSMVFTNAAGGINLDAGARRPGADLRPHQSAGHRIRWSVRTTIAGAALPRHVGRLFPRYREIAKTGRVGTLHSYAEGVYAAMLGPCYETPAEIRFLRTIGADVVGMSTVPK